MTTATAPPRSAGVRVAYDELIAFVTAVFATRGVPVARARLAAEALCYADCTGHGSHGVANLRALYLPLFDDARVDARAEPSVVADTGAAVLLDARRALGLWAASEAMDMATERAARHGIGMVSVRGATHFGCAGHHALRAVRHGMVGIVASNCGRQRIARPPGGRVAMLGTNPFSVAAPAGSNPPFVLDMSTTVVPTGRIREAARAGIPVPEGWLEDDRGRAVCDAGAFDRGDAHLLWLGSAPGTGAYKGYGLGLAVEVLAALVPGAGLGPAPEALAGDGRPSGRDDDVGFLVIALAPATLRPREDFDRQAQGLFGSLLACPPAPGSPPVCYPGWREAERASDSARLGVPLEAWVYEQLEDVARGARVPPPSPVGFP